ncbi:hypothetical protein SAUDAGE_19 [Paenibacillus phage Saudage]|uniref:XkdX family protein n=1 Tax=Paenibacillus phage Saudage TaxID=2249770 RepID=A0A345AU76_9CAUD|nr:hypothetical protein SAUDAGE_19 [Paenibacillus phage Saudage]
MKSELYPHFYYCWCNQTVTPRQLERAVEKGYITEKERKTICKVEVRDDGRPNF